MNKKIIIGLVISSLIVISGFIQINIVNTKALSPVGTGEDNYNLVKEEFGSDFEEFIRDNSEIKIYSATDTNEDTTIKIGKKEYKIDKENIAFKASMAIGNIISSGIHSIKEKINLKTNENNKVKINTEVDAVIDDFINSKEVNKNQETNSNENVNKDNKEEWVAPKE